MKWSKWIRASVTGVLAFGSVLVGTGRDAVAQNKELNLFCWTEYVPKEVIDGFTKETGIKVNLEEYDSNEQMLTKLLAGAAKYDLVQPSEYTVEAMVKQNLLQEIDASKIPNLGNILPEFRGLPHDPENKYTVTWMSGTVGIVVNTEKVTEPITSFKDVFQDKYKGRIVALDDSREIASWAMAMQGLDVNKVDADVLDKIRPTVEKMVSLIKVYDSTSPKTSLTNGDVDLGVVWSGEAAILWSENKKFKYVLPSEGTHRFIDSFAIPKTAANPDAAHAFINYILRPEVSVLISENFPYTNPNGEARKLLAPEQRDNPASYPPGNPKLDTFRDIGGRATRMIEDMVSEIRSSN